MIVLDMSRKYANALGGFPDRWQVVSLYFRVTRVPRSFIRAKKTRHAGGFEMEVCVGL